MSNSRTFIFFLAAILLVYMGGLFVDVMEIDAAQYATMSWEMHESGSYLQLYCNGQDYLDKPPFLFWVNQVSFFLFGVHGWSYKLPTFVFLLAGLFSVYKLGRLLYDQKTARIATIILGSTVGWVLLANDVRTDGILCSAIIFTVWQWKAFSLDKKWKHLLGISVGISVGMLVKGPLGFMIPAAIMGIVFILNREWKMIFCWKYILVLIFVGLALSPMLYGLYLQYDLQPGKIVNGEKISSGLRFYFWTQSFGRITGESNWSNHPSVFYFLPVILWAFFPWSIFLVQSFIAAFKTGTRKSFLPLAGFIIPFIALSLSRYKLPHYIFICFPFMALLSAHYISGLKTSLFSKIPAYFLHFFAWLAIPVAGYCMEVHPAIIILFSVLVFVIYLISALRLKDPVVTGTWISLSGLYLFINLFFFPAVMKYQSSSQAGQAYYLAAPDKNIPLVEIDTWGFATEFYAHQEVKFYPSIDALVRIEGPGEYWVHISEKAYPDLEKKGIVPPYTVIFHHYPVSKLKPGFLWPGTRDRYISKTRLVKVYLPGN